MSQVLKSILSITLLILLLVFFTTSSCAQGSDKQLKKELLKRTEELNMGVKTHDTTALKDILAREYQLTGPKFSQPTLRQKWLENVNSWSFDSVTMTRISLASWGEVAVFRSLQHFYNLVVGNNKPVAKSPGSWVTDLWVKRDGRWQLVTRLRESMVTK